MASTMALGFILNKPESEQIYEAYNVLNNTPTMEDRFSHLNDVLDASKLHQKTHKRTPYGPDYPYMKKDYPNIDGLVYRAWTPEPAQYSNQHPQQGREEFGQQGGLDRIMAQDHRQTNNYHWTNGNDQNPVDLTRSEVRQDYWYQNGEQDQPSTGVMPIPDSRPIPTINHQRNPDQASSSTHHQPQNNNTRLPSFERPLASKTTEIGVTYNQDLRLPPTKLLKTTPKKRKWVAISDSTPLTTAPKARSSRRALAIGRKKPVHNLRQDSGRLDHILG